MMSSVIAPLGAVNYPRPQNSLRSCGNSRRTLWDERPFILRTRSEMASFGGTDTNM